MRLFSPHTLHLKLSKSSSLLRGVLFFLLTIPLFLLATEVTARSPLGNLLPAPSIKADSFVFDAKLYALEQQVRRDGGIDCLFIGSSVTNSDIDPEAIEAAYKQRTGETIHCFNFGFPAMTIENATALTDAVIEKFAPKVILYTVLSRDIDHISASADFLEDSLWTRYQRREDWSLEGWLVDRSYAYRYYNTWRYWLTVPNRAKMESEVMFLTPKGFQPATGIRDPYTENFTMTPKRLTQMWKVSSRVEALNQFLALRQKGVKLVIVEGPVYNDPTNDATDPARIAYETDYIPPLADMLGEQDILFIRSAELAVQIPKPHWYDWLHLNNQGAATFSQWLGEQLAANAWLFE